MRERGRGPAHAGPSELAGTRALVAGIGVSGLAAARALAHHGATVTAVDAALGEPAERRAAELRALGIDARVGVDFGVSGLVEGHDLVVASPGVAESSPLLVAAAARGLPVWSEPELAWRLAGGRASLVAVTGTNGKTTTTELLGALLDAPTGGNIGTPLVDLLDAEDPPAVVAAELSSFQLRFCERLRPDVAVLLNLAPDHLDWHGGLEAYAAAKAQVWAAQGRDDVVVLGDDEGAFQVARDHPPPGRVVLARTTPPRPGEVGVEEGAIVARVGPGGGAAPPARVVGVDELALRGEHNVANAAAAVAAALASGAAPASLAGVLRRHRAGAHRLALVAERGGVRWINDSKATNPHAASASLRSVAAEGASGGAGAHPGRRVVWIAGGLAKGLDLRVLTPVVAEHVKVAFAIGASGDEVETVARQSGVEAEVVGTVEAAVRRAAAVAEPGDVVLLAPACASMDQFRDYAERGEAFATAVAGLDADAHADPAPERRR